MNPYATIDIDLGDRSSLLIISRNDGIWMILQSGTSGVEVRVSIDALRELKRELMLKEDELARGEVVKA